MTNSDELVPKEESSDDDLIDLTRLSEKEILELAKGKYGKRDGGDGSKWSIQYLLYLIRIIYHVLRPWCTLSLLEDFLDDFAELGIPPKSLIHNILAVLPIPQIVILIFLPTTRNSRSLNRMKFLNSFIILQYVARVYPMYRICMEVNKDTREDSKELAKHKKIWIPGVLNFIVYILASHVLGVFWYFFSFQREIGCWISACRSENGCDLSTSQSDKTTFRNVTLINDLCPTNTPNPKTFMQAISRTSKIWQRVGVIFPQIGFMVSEYGLKEGVESAISQLVREAVEGDEDNPVQNIFLLLPLELQKHLKRHLFLSTLTKLPGLENKDRQVLDAIMKNLEPVNYADGSYIIREGEPLDRMLFITQGIALAYKTSGIDGGSGSSGIIRLAKRDFYGEELIGWAAASTSSSDLPILAKTVKSHAKLEVFALVTDDLRLVVSKFPTQFNTELPQPADSALVEISIS